MIFQKTYIISNRPSISSSPFERQIAKFYPYLFSVAAKNSFVFAISDTLGTSVQNANLRNLRVFELPVRVPRSLVNCLTFDGKRVTWIAYQFLQNPASYIYIQYTYTRKMRRRRDVNAYTSPGLSRVLSLFVPLFDRHSRRTILLLGVLPDYNVCRRLCKLPCGSVRFLSRVRAHARTHARTYRRKLHVRAPRNPVLKQYKQWARAVVMVTRIKTKMCTISRSESFEMKCSRR